MGFLKHHPLAGDNEDPSLVVLSGVLRAIGRAQQRLCKNSLVVKQHRIPLDAYLWFNTSSFERLEGIEIRIKWLVVETIASLGKTLKDQGILIANSKQS